MKKKKNRKNKRKRRRRIGWKKIIRMIGIEEEKGRRRRRIGKKESGLFPVIYRHLFLVIYL